MLEKFLKEQLGVNNVKIVEFDQPILPLYLKKYIYRVFRVFSSEFVFVEPKDTIDIRTYSVQKKAIEYYFGRMAVVILKQTSSAFRRSLITRNMMFVEIGKQLYLPAVGVSLQKDRATFTLPLKRFTPQTQACALYFLYNSQIDVTEYQIASRLELNLMAVSRGVRALEDLDLLTVENMGRIKRLNLAVDKRDFVKKIEPFCINPVRKKAVVPRWTLPNGGIECGYSALARQTMIASNELHSYAVTQSQYLTLCEKYDPDSYGYILYDSDSVELEIWKYPPDLFAEYKMVDKYSLYLSFDKDDIDERTEDALEQLKESIFYEIL